VPPACVCEAGTADSPSEYMSDHDRKLGDLRPSRALDDVMPRFEFSERHKRQIDAPPDRVAEALRTLGMRDVLFTRVLMGIRTLPARLTGRGLYRGGDRPLIEDFVEGGFVVLAERERELVLGVVGQFWHLRQQPEPEVTDPVTFAAFDKPGFAKAAMDFRAEPSDGGTLLETETRIHTTDTAARRRFGLYWIVIRPGSGLIRRDLLRAVAQRAERTHELVRRSL
jgi:hypothetical protein